MSQILTEMEIRKVHAEAGAGTSPIVSSIIDSAGCESVLFFANIGTANAGNYLSVAESDDSGMSGEADLLGSKVIGLVSGNVIAVEIFKPSKRYLRATMTVGSSSTVGTMYCIRKVKKLPALNTVASVIDSEIHATPAEGTA